MAETPTRPELAVLKRPPSSKEPAQVKARVEPTDVVQKEAEQRARPATTPHFGQTLKDKPGVAKVGKLELEPKENPPAKSENPRVPKPAAHWAATDARPLQRKSSSKGSTEPNILNPRQAAGEKTRLGTAFTSADKVDLGPAVVRAAGTLAQASAGASRRGGSSGSARPPEDEEQTGLADSNVKLPTSG